MDEDLLIKYYSKMNSKKGARIQTETVKRHNLVNNKKASFYTPKFSIDIAFIKAGF